MSVLLQPRSHAWEQGALTRAQMDQLRQMLLDAASRYDGTVSLLRATTAALSEANATVEALTAHVRRLDAALAQAQQGQAPRVLH